jgi:hypothetical protein
MPPRNLLVVVLVTTIVIALGLSLLPLSESPVAVLASTPPNLSFVNNATEQSSTSRTHSLQTPETATHAAPAFAQPVSAAPIDSVSVAPTALPTTSTPAREGHHHPRCVNEWKPPQPSSLEKGCAWSHNIRCEGGKRGRALVVYFLRTFDEDSTAVQPEAWSANLFSRFGIPDNVNEGSILFDRVDTVVVRMREDITKPRVHATSQSISLIDVVGNAVRDGYHCGQSRALEFLGGARNVSGAYHFVAFVHSGVNGPFQHSRAPFWLDVLAMGGQDILDDETPPMFVSPSLFAGAGHIVGMHRALVEHHAVFLDAQCPPLTRRSGGPKVVDTKPLLPVWWLHGLVRNVTLRAPLWGYQYLPFPSFLISTE